MLNKPSLVTRVAVGKTTGFAVGLLGFVTLPYLWSDADLMMRWGFLLWYTTVGVVIGMAGVFTWHPVLRMRIPWWALGALLGAWLNFVLALLIYDPLAQAMVAVFGPELPLTSPFWFCLEGALVGCFIAFLATKFGGEGPKTVRSLEAPDK
ncbi:MAG: hypothetical protein HOI95_05250 [Chromatiales bacterium]|jgi:hypothetical protein|nr:hypothetical protein [Chromatiales bacterium]